MQVANQKVVSIHYTLTDPAGKVIDSSREAQPLVYLHGAGGIIPGLEAALAGKEKGNDVVATIAPEQAYGQTDPNKVQAIPRDRFPAEVKITAGMQFQAQTPVGPRVVTVVEADDKTVKIDANHPLAGITLKFDVRIVDVRDASAEELKHGHVHGAGGHQH